MASKFPSAGTSYAFICLIILGAMPVISNSRPSGFSALSFAFFLSLWQLLFSLPLVFKEIISSDKGIFEARLPVAARNRTIAIILITGAIFGLSTYFYVLSIEKAGAVSAAIAIQAYPLFAIILETLFLKRKKTALELVFTFLLLGALYYLATSGTFYIAGVSYWFMLALCVPFLWSIAHVIIKEVLDKTPITPAQVTFFRVLVSVVFLFAVFVTSKGAGSIMRDFWNIDFQKIAILMGLAYYLELIIWFYAIRKIDVSVASSITVPAPALTMMLAVLVLNETVEVYQLVTLGVISLSVYGLLIAGSRKHSH